MRLLQGLLGVAFFTLCGDYEVEINEGNKKINGGCMSELRN